MTTTTLQTSTPYRKCFLPLESNPAVFTELAHKLGLAASLRFEDVLSLDDPELMELVPRPVHALILVFPTTDTYEKRCASEEAKVDSYDGSGEREPVVFFKQTIHNACGLYAVLHAMSNGSAKRHIAKESIMARLLEETVQLKPEERALVLEDSKELESAYTSVATEGDTQAPENAEDEVDFHYICFV
jgi:ubiquitin carboxyl-terminal hydrolase L3